MIIFLPVSAELNQRIGKNGLDSEPIQKWAEDGFTVVGVGLGLSSSGWSIEDLDAFNTGFGILLAAKEINVKDKFAVIGVIHQILTCF